MTPGPAASGVQPQLGAAKTVGSVDPGARPRTFAAPTESAPVPRSLRLSWPLLAVLLAVLSTAGPAAADYRDVLDECETGLSRQYSAKDLRLAAQKMSAYQRDYTNCSDAIVQAQTSGKRARDRAGSGNGSTTGGAGGGTGSTNGGTAGGSGSTSAPPADAAPSPTLTPDQQHEARTAAAAAADASGTIEQAFAAARVPPEALALSSASSSLPVTLVVALVASAVLALVAAVFSVLARVRRSRVD